MGAGHLALKAHLMNSISRVLAKVSQGINPTEVVRRICASAICGGFVLSYRYFAQCIGFDLSALCGGFASKIPTSAIWRWAPTPKTYSGFAEYCPYVADGFSHLRKPFTTYGDKKCARSCPYIVNGRPHFWKPIYYLWTRQEKYAQTASAT